VLIRLRYAALSAVMVAFGAGVPTAIATGAVKVGYTRASGPAAAPVPLSPAATPQAGGIPASASPQSPPRQLIVPDLVAVVPAGITAAQVSAISGLAGVRAVLAVDGGQMLIGGRAASVLGVPPQAFRSWTPPATAAATGIWARLSTGQLVASPAAAGRLGLAAGRSYRVSAASPAQAPYGAAAELGIPGVDAIVSSGLAARLGLAANVAVLVNAPAADLATLMRQAKDILGPGGKVLNLVPVGTAASLPVDDNVPAGHPANWLQLYQESAARYCPGLSWTVLAAIGEIESGGGANDGPATAGGSARCSSCPPPGASGVRTGSARRGAGYHQPARRCAFRGAHPVCRRRGPRQRGTLGQHTAGRTRAARLRGRGSSGAYGSLLTRAASRWDSRSRWGRPKARLVTTRP